MPGPINRALEHWAGTNPGPVHRIVGRVAALDVADAFVQGHGLAGRPGGHVGEDQCIHDRPVFDWEGGQFVD
jgi:hypothetical protein